MIGLVEISGSSRDVRWRVAELNRVARGLWDNGAWRQMVLAEMIAATLATVPARPLWRVNP